MYPLLFWASVGYTTRGCIWNAGGTLFSCFKMAWDRDIAFKTKYQSKEMYSLLWVSECGTIPVYQHKNSSGYVTTFFVPNEIWMFSSIHYYQCTNENQP